MWSDKESRVYSDRTDLDAATFQRLVDLTVRRRVEVTRANALALWKRDQLDLALDVLGVLFA